MECGAPNCRIHTTACTAYEYAIRCSMAQKRIGIEFDLRGSWVSTNTVSADRCGTVPETKTNTQNRNCALLSRMLERNISGATNIRARRGHVARCKKPQHPKPPHDPHNALSAIQSKGTNHTEESILRCLAAISVCSLLLLRGTQLPHSAVASSRRGRSTPYL